MDNLDGLRIYADDPEVANARVSVTVFINEHGSPIATVPRAKFIAAIETELDGTWIDHADLPAVTEDSDRPGNYDVGGAPFTHRADVVALYRVALQYIAVARHLEANPPVDEAAVDALAKTLNDNDLGNRLARADLERLVQAGVRAPEAGEDQ